MWGFPEGGTGVGGYFDLGEGVEGGDTNVRRVIESDRDCVYGEVVGWGGRGDTNVRRVIEVIERGGEEEGGVESQKAAG